jgi:hypothetical protein
MVCVFKNLREIVSGVFHSYANRESDDPLPPIAMASFQPPSINCQCGGESVTVINVIQDELYPDDYYSMLQCDDCGKPWYISGDIYAMLNVGNEPDLFDWDAERVVTAPSRIDNVINFPTQEDD